MPNYGRVPELLNRGDVHGGVPTPPKPLGGSDCHNTFLSEALLGLRQEVSPLSATFFSEANLNYVQSELQNRVFLKTKHHIGRQSDDEMKVIMRSTYAIYALHIPGKVAEEISGLNERVLAYAVPNVVSNVLQYLHMLKDAVTAPQQMALPMHPGMKGTKGLYTADTVRFF
jgi:hypothetical protein